MSDDGINGRSMRTIGDAIRSGAFTALWTFIGLFGVTLLGWIQGVSEWASSSGRSPLPGLSVLGYGVVAAFAAGVSGIVGFVVRAVQIGTGKGNPPTFSK